MYTISKEYHFSAAHQLIGLPAGHQCGRLHGHNYILKVVLKSDELDMHGFVQDYGALKMFKDYVDDVLDHKNLNDVFKNNTTVENITYEIYHRFKGHYPKLVAIELSETPKTNCRYEPLQ